MKKLLLLFFLSCTLSLWADTSCIPKKSNPQRLVNDFAKVLSPSFKNQLEQRLINFNDTTSTQIVLITVSDLCGEEASFFAFELGEQWGVGNEKFDNGIVVLFKPKQANSKGEIFIATGYGLEGVLPDAIAKRIVENEMIPNFKQSQVEKGLFQGIQVIMEITGGEYSADNYNSRNKKGNSSVPGLFVLFFIIVFITSMFGSARGYSKRNNMGLLAALFLMNSGSRSHKGRFNDFGSGSGGFGGGGGFGGFGGGSFGGGGAGGSW